MIIRHFRHDTVISLYCELLLNYEPKPNQREKIRLCWFDSTGHLLCYEMSKKIIYIHIFLRHLEQLVIKLYI